jgi:hypothetical protein
MALTKVNSILVDGTINTTAAGNVGIGTTTPNANSGTSLVVYDASTPRIRLTNSTTGQAAGDGAELTIFNSDFFIENRENANTIFYNNGAERMRITPAGALLVGETSTSGPSWISQNLSNDWVLIVRNSNNSLPNGLFINYNNAAPNNTARDFIYASDSSAVRFSVRSNGGIQNYSANNSNLSDAREKTNVELAGSYLDKICAIPVKTFNYIDQNLEEDDGLTLGVIAQDVQAVAPELVSESNWAAKDEPEKMRLSIYQTDLQYALMKCIQEQQAIITDLKARIETIEAK